MKPMSRIRWLVVLGAVAASALGAQNVQNATLRQALAAYDNLDIPRAIALARQALSQRLGGDDQARAWELLGFAYSASDSLLKAVDALKRGTLITPNPQPIRARYQPRSPSPSILAPAKVRGRRSPPC